MFYLLLAAIAIPAYILGSVNGAIITSKNFYHKDIREYGSKNPGLTNFYRVFGKARAFLVVLIDVLKTVLPVLFGGWLLGRYCDMTLFGREFAGLFVVLGHCFPVFYKFQGGKGVMAAGTILLVVDWRLALACWGTFIVITALTRYVSLGAISAGLSLPVSQFLLKMGGTKELIIALICGMLIVARHHQNIRRLLRGEESKLKLSRKKNK